MSNNLAQETVSRLAAEEESDRSEDMTIYYMQSLAKEALRHREVMKRIEEMTLSMEHALDPNMRALGDELRKRMKAGV